MHKVEFADDVVLLAPTRHVAKAAIRARMNVTKAFDLRVQSAKDKVHGGWAQL